MSALLPGAGFDALTNLPCSVTMISVLIVWRFFLPEYQQRCLRDGLWIGCSVQSMIKASASARLTRMLRFTLRTRTASCSIRRSDRQMAALSTKCKLRR